MFTVKGMGDFLFLIVAVNSYGQTGIASRYPGDINIQNDPHVIFADMFEEPNIKAVIANWTNYKDSVQMSLVTDVPSGSTGKTSIRFTAVGGSVNWAAKQYIF